MIEDLSKRDNTPLRELLSKKSRVYWMLWSIVKAIIKWLPFLPSNINTYVTKWFGAKIGKRVYISRDVDILFPFNLEIGDNTLILKNVFIHNLAPIKIGKNVAIAPRCTLISSSHIPFDPKFTLIVEPIIIEDSVWLGVGTTVLNGVTIHKGAVVGACSLVKEDVPPLTMVAGVPAKIIKQET